MESIVNTEAIDGSQEAEVTTESTPVGGQTDISGIMTNLGEEYKDNATLSKFSTGEDLAKSYIDLQKLVGSKVEKIPTNESEQAELDEFYGKLGLQEGENYSLQSPEWLNDVEGGSERLEKAMASARDAGLSDYQANKMFSQILANEQADNDAYEAQQKEVYDTGITELKETYGEGFDGVMGEVKSLQDKLGVFDEFEGSGLNNNPMLIKAFAKIALDIGEKSTMDKVVSTTPAGKEMEISELNSQIQEIIRQGGNVPTHLSSRLSKLFNG